MPERSATVAARVGPPENSVEVEWDLELVRTMASGEDIQQPWRLEGRLDWEQWHSLSVLSAAFDDGSVLTFAALHPRRAPGHDEDIVLALHAGSGCDPAPLEDVLISTQSDADGVLTRINLEASEGTEPVIVRAAGDVDSHQDAEPVERSFLRVRMGGSAGFGTLDVLSRP